MKIGHLLLLLAATLWAAPARADSFSQFLHAFEPTAVAAGVSATVYELSTKGLTPDPSIAEYIKSPRRRDVTRYTNHRWSGETTMSAMFSERTAAGSGTCSAGPLPSAGIQ